MKTKFIFSILAAALFCNAGATDTLTRTHTYFKSQFAGNIGIVSVGYGKLFFKNHLSLDFNYGFIPQNVNHSKIHSFALRPSWHFLDKKLAGLNTGLYSGISIVYSITRNTYLKYPDYFPINYYEQNALHFNPYLGFSAALPVLIKKANAVTFFYELGSTDLEIWYAIKNKLIKPMHIINLSFGIGLNFY